MIQKETVTGKKTGSYPTPRVHRHFNPWGGAEGSSTPTDRVVLPSEEAAGSWAMEHLPIPQLIGFLQSSFRKCDFDEAARILISREQSLRAELESKFSDEIAIKEVERVKLESALVAIRRRCGELEELTKIAQLGLDTERGEMRRKLAEEKERRTALEVEAVGWKSRIDALGKQVEQYRKTQMGFDAERKALERKLAEEKERRASLEEEIAATKTGMGASERQMKYYKRTCESLEEQVLRMKEECEVLSKREGNLQERIRFLLRNSKELEEIDGLKSDWEELEVKVRQLEENCSSRGTQRERNGKTEEERGREHAPVLLLQGDVGSDGMMARPMKAGAKPVLGEVIEISDDEDEIYHIG